MIINTVVKRSLKGFSVQDSEDTIYALALASDSHTETDTPFWMIPNVQEVTRMVKFKLVAYSMTSCEQVASECNKCRSSD